MVSWRYIHPHYVEGIADTADAGPAFLAKLPLLLLLAHVLTNTDQSSQRLIEQPAPAISRNAVKRRPALLTHPFTSSSPQLLIAN